MSHQLLEKRALRRAEAEQPEAEVLIEEVRRRARRRRLLTAAVVVLLAGLGGGIYAGVSGPPEGHSHQTNPSSSPPGAAANPSRSSRPLVISDALSRVQAVGAIASTELWAYAMPGLVVSMDGGRSWRTLSVEGSPSWFDDLAGISTNHVWFAVSEFPAPGAVNPNLNNGSIRAEVIGRSTNGGKLWRVVAIPDSQLSDITLDFANANDGFAISGANATGVSAAPNQTNNVLFRTTDGGASWTRVSSAPIEGPVEFTSAEDGWALPIAPQGTGKSNLLHTLDGGATWQPVDPAPRNVTAYFSAPPHFFNADEGVVTAEVFLSDSTTSTFVVYVTLNGGKTWVARPIARLAGYEPSLSPISTTDWVVATTSRIYRTSNAGLSWTATVPTSSSYANAQAVVFSNFTDGIARINYQLFHTVDGGRHWGPVVTKSVKESAASVIVNEFPSN